MKYLIKVDDILLTPEQTEQVSEILAQGEAVERRWKDMDFKLRKEPASERITLRPISSAQVAAMELSRENDED